MTPKIRHLFISQDHNFYGHYGGEPGTNPAIAEKEITCVAGHGIRGDRFFDYKPDYKGQITFVMWENLTAMWEELGVPPEERDPGATRRNVITEGLDLNPLVGKEFEVQGVKFLGTQECSPCLWMNQAIHPAAEKWLHRRGGLRAKILTDGVLRVTE